MKIKEKTYKKIKSSIISQKYGVELLKILNKLTTTIVYLTYPIMLILLILNRDLRFWKVLFIPGISFIIVSRFRKYVNLPRPYEVWDIKPILDKNTQGESFPSRHVFSIFVIAMTLYYISNPLGIGLMFIGIIVSIVRVLGGVHFPRDVIAGAIIGVLFSLIGWNISIF